MSSARRERFSSTRALPVFAWVMLIAIFGVQLSFIVFAGVENPINMIFAVSFAACTMLVFVRVQMLDYPFEGCWRSAMPTSVVYASGSVLS